ncbi:hypothetical protein PG985_015683 [Apiospora marii]|uniref:uncharacterized protein n=1 Tax=Apiospora marii TaxID=335849 RepID=UPI00312D7000
MPVYHPSNTVIYGRISGNRLRLLRTGDRPSLAILRTNKQVHAEASSILYGDNSVDLSGEEYPFFLSRGSCSRQYAGLIRRLALGYPQWYHYTTFLPSGGAHDPILPLFSKAVPPWSSPTCVPA